MKSFAVYELYLPLHPLTSRCVKTINALGFIKHKGKYQSGQMGQTVNLLAFAFGGSNPSLPTAARLQKRK